MERQNQEAATEAAEAQVATSPRLTASALLGFTAKCLFLIAVAYFLVNRYGIVHLIWLALVGWYMVVPTLTPTQKNVYK